MLCFIVFQEQELKSHSFHHGLKTYCKWSDLLVYVQVWVQLMWHYLFSHLSAELITRHLMLNGGPLSWAAGGWQQRQQPQEQFACQRTLQMVFTLCAFVEEALMEQVCIQCRFDSLWAQVRQLPGEIRFKAFKFLCWVHNVGFQFAKRYRSFEGGWSNQILTLNCWVNSHVIVKVSKSKHWIFCNYFNTQCTEVIDLKYCSP